MIEIWKDIEGYEGFYQVSNLGNVRSLNWGKQGYVRNLYLKHHPRGYRQVELVKNGKRKMLTVHRLVAQAFIPNPDGLTSINHKDEDKTNNRVENLEWCDKRYNFWYSWDLHHTSRPMKKVRKRTNSSYSNHLNKVAQLNLDGTVVRIWDNIASIKRELSFNNWSITQCCKGNRATAYGFRWQFVT